MKYPEKQFKVLEQAVKELSTYIDIKNVNTHTLHYTIYEQLCKSGQEHNKLYCIPGGSLKRFGNMNEAERVDSIKLLDIDFDFQLYPEGCNDSHIETAMKQLFKNMGL